MVVERVEVDDRFAVATNEAALCDRDNVHPRVRLRDVVDLGNAAEAM